MPTGVCWGCGKTGRENGDMDCPNIRVHRGKYDTIKLEKGEISRAVRSYAEVTREDVHTSLGKNRLVFPNLSISSRYIFTGNDGAWMIASIVSTACPSP